ncbi:hypothetical protein K504DRAFT_508050 [Pleomassaria siparia CBS 279.74]|uniref:Uncharacterized protein n=1 Tax=Pleomassaria siparia CBS 279.74 TaxID=1314801 RepID=A0A6G1JTD5_9PLEO|nr:hypothetical protein K504DRAFT_508050 [Pleomassaria siparia CBS 279.74]
MLFLNIELELCLDHGYGLLTQTISPLLVIPRRWIVLLTTLGTSWNFGGKGEGASSSRRQSSSSFQQIGVSSKPNMRSVMSDKILPPTPIGQELIKTRSDISDTDNHQHSQPATRISRKGRVTNMVYGYLKPSPETKIKKEMGKKGKKGNCQEVSRPEKSLGTR